MRRIIFFFICYFALQSLFAQDPVFTQFYASPMLMNPSFAGSGGNTRIGVGYRNQWNGSNYKLSTSYASVDNWIESINSGLGLSLLNQKEELTNYNFTQINLSYSYHLKLSDKLTFFPGISFGYGLKHFNFQNLVLGDQINILDGTISPSSDPFVENDKINFFDISVGGILYFENAWLGTSLKHLTKPNISFLNDENLPLAILLSIHGGYRLTLNQNSDQSFLPNNSFLFLTFNYIKQDTYNRLDLGAEVEISKFYFGVLTTTQVKNTNDDSQFLLSVNPLVGLQFKKLKIGFSYDFPISDIGNIAGTSEITIQYSVGKSKTRKRIWQIKN